MRSSIRAALAACLLVLSACGGGASGADAPVPAALRIYVTDAPFPGDLVACATVVIREVRVREASGGGWQTVFEGEQEIDLVPLTGGVSMLLVDAELPPGTYDEARLIVDSGRVVLEPEATVAGNDLEFTSENGGLHMPSGAQTGIKVKIDNDIVVTTALTAELTLDFDLAKNFVFNGPIDRAPGVQRVLFTPTVRAVNSSTAGRVQFEVWSDNATPDDTDDDFPIENATVEAFDDADELAGSGLTSEVGFMALQLPGGTYRIEVGAPGHEGSTQDDVVVAVANLTTLDPIVLAATSGEIRGLVQSDGATTDSTDDDLVWAGASVTATLQGETEPAATTTTDAQGTYRFEALAPGLYDIAVTADGFRDGASLGVVPTAGGTIADVTLEALTQRLTGTVTDAEGNPLAGIDVVARNAAGVTIGQTTTDDQGTYALSLPTGAQDVTWTQADPAVEVEAQIDVVGTDPESDIVRDQVL